MNKSIYRWYVVFINAFIGCAISAGFPQSSMTIPYISQKTGIGQEVLLAGDTIRTVGIIIAMIISGLIYKKIGAKKTFILGMVLLIPPIIVIPYVNNLMLFYLLKFSQGMSVIIFPMFLVIIMDWMDEKNRGLSTAVFNGVFYGGAGIGGTCSGFVIARFGWVASYWALAVVQLGLAVIWFITVKENPVRQEAVVEKKGEVSFSRLMKKPLIWLLVLAFISTTWSVQAISVDMPLYAAFLGYNELETGKILSSVTIGIIGASIVSGKISDFIAHWKRDKGVARVMVYEAGCFIVIGAIIMFLLLDLTDFTVFYIAVLIFSFGASWGLGAFYCILPELFDNERLPVVTGFIGGWGDAGMTLSPVAVGIIFGVKGHWHIGWSLCIAVAVFSIIACFMIIKQIKKTQRG